MVLSIVLDCSIQEFLRIYNMVGGSIWYLLLVMFLSTLSTGTATH